MYMYIVTSGQWILYLTVLAWDIFSINFRSQLVTQLVKKAACNAGDLGLILSWEDPLEKGEATHSSILA